MKNYIKHPHRVLIDNAKKDTTFIIDKRSDSSAWLFTNDKKVMKEMEEVALRWNHIYNANGHVGMEFELSKDSIKIQAEQGGC